MVDSRLRPSLFSELTINCTPICTGNAYPLTSFNRRQPFIIYFNNDFEIQNKKIIIIEIQALSQLFYSIFGLDGDSSGV